MEPLLILCGLLGAADAAPYRLPPPRPQVLHETPGRHSELLWVKLQEDAGLSFDGQVVHGPGRLSELNRLLEGARPLFTRPAEVIRADAKTYDPEGRLADLTLWLQLKHPDAAAVGTALLLQPSVESVEFAPLPMPPRRG